jgi:hypothetical protein
MPRPPLASRTVFAVARETMALAVALHVGDLELDPEGAAAFRVY